MSLLLYCVTTPLASLDPSQAGVGETPVLRMQSSALVIFFSQSPTPDPWLRAPLGSSAAEFHHVLQQLFKSAAIIPFRFPTILNSDEELAKHLAQHSEEYEFLLEKFRSCVQMDVLVGYSSDTTQVPSARSGAEYLRARQRRNDALNRLASELRAPTARVAKEWRQRAVHHGVRCFALLERDHIREFNDNMRTVSVPAGMNVRVSGPWPVAEFLDLKQN
jgi:gas vesicle protein GvpL/GvpF